MYHLGWFLGTGCGIQAWNPSAGDGVFTGTNVVDWMKPDIYIDLARSLERAGFDYLLLEDTAQIDDTFRGDAEVTLRRGLYVPKNDPMPLAALIAQSTNRIGIVPTCSTTQYPPYLAARLYTTLDHVSDGRVGINVVTSSSRQAAQSYGMDAIPPKAERYAMANEWVEIVQQLQESWEPGAVRADADGGCYADASKVHTIDYAGTYFRCRGPLNTIPGPQRAVPVLQAGNSPEGRDLTARFGSSLLAMAHSLEGMKQLRLDMHERVARFGRKSTDLKVMFLVSPVLGATDQEARDRADSMERYRQSDAHLEYQLWLMDHFTSGMIPFGEFDLDVPIKNYLNNLDENAITPLTILVKGNEERTLREITAGRTVINDMGLIGSPATVAAMMDEMMDEIGGDGFLIDVPITRRNIAEVADGLAPALQKRGSVRSSYDYYPTLRENLLAF